MACGCGQTLHTRQAIATAQTSGAGSYPLFHYPNCAQLHSGAFMGRSVYVVSRGDERERMFARQDLPAAAAYAQEVRMQIENLPTAALCDAAVLAVYGAPG